MATGPVDPRPYALATALFGAALLFVAWQGDFDSPTHRLWAGGLGGILLAVSVLLAPRPPKR